MAGNLVINILNVNISLAKECYCKTSEIISDNFLVQSIIFYLKYKVVENMFLRTKNSEGN